jgi:hypothetical protein
VYSSGRIYIIDTITDPLKPALHKTIEPEEIIEKTGLAFPHTAHCLANGDVMVSCLGDKEGRAEGAGFLLIDEKFNVKGRFVLESLRIGLICWLTLKFISSFTCYKNRLFNGARLKFNSL